MINCVFISVFIMGIERFSLKSTLSNFAWRIFKMCKVVCL